MKNIKMLFATFFVVLLAVLLNACGSRNKLLLLNWGEYINEDLIEKFEKETGYEVSLSIADSNELFYSKVKSGTTVYDLVIPSDYMIEKMVEKDLLHEIDISKLKNHPSNNDEVHFMEGAIGIQHDMFQKKG